MLLDRTFVRVPTAQARTVRRWVGIPLLDGIAVYLLMKAADWIAYMGPTVAWFVSSTDHAIYMSQAHRVLSGGPMYQAWQLAGPYVVTPDGLAHPEMYPPFVVLGLFVPMALLPDFLWWAIPLGIITAMVGYHRPSLWGWVGILACLAAPPTWQLIACGNPALWAAAAVGLGTRWGWPGALAMLKPSLLPFALVGIRSRGWWVALAAVCAFSLVTLPLTIDWIRLTLNAQGYSAVNLGNVPLLLIPVIAWVARRPRHTPRTSWLTRAVSLVGRATTSTTPAEASAR